MGGHVLDTCVVIDLKAAGLLHLAAHNLAKPAVGFFAAHEVNELASHLEELRRFGVRVHELPGAKAGSYARHQLPDVLKGEGGRAIRRPGS